MKTISFSDAVLEAIAEAMEADPSVVMLGDSVADPVPTRGSTGLVERFGPERVIRTPVSEDSMTGAAIGMALAGMRPLQVHIRCDFAMLAMNQLVNIAAKVRGMYGNAVGGVPLTVRLTVGRSWGQGAQHSQGLQSLFAHIPGLRVVMPSTPGVAKGAMAWCLKHSQDPVIFIDHRMLWKIEETVPTGPLPDCAPGFWRKTRDGSDLTIVAISHANVEVERACRHLQALGIDATVFDPVWIRPLRLVPELIESVKRTRGRLLVVDCGWPSFGVSAEIVAAVAESGAVRQAARMGFAETTCPTSHALEALYYPNAATIAAKAFEMVTGKVMPAWEPESAPEVAAFRGPF